MNVKDEARNQIKKTGAFLRDLIFGEEEPGDFLTRKALEEGASPGLMADLIEVMTPNPAPPRVVDVEEDEERGGRGEARTSPGTPQAKRRTGPPPELESACHACRLARRINGRKCVEHS